MSRPHFVAAVAVGLLLASQVPGRAADPNDVLPDDSAKLVVVKGCTSCHQAPVIVAKRHTPEEWDEIIGKMVDRGASLTEAEQDQVYAYLVKNFGPEAQAAPAPPPEGERGR